MEAGATDAVISSLDARQDAGPVDSTPGDSPGDAAASVPSVLDLLSSAYERGDIDYETWLLRRLQAAYRPWQLPPEYRPQDLAPVPHEYAWVLEAERLLPKLTEAVRADVIAALRPPNGTTPKPRGAKDFDLEGGYAESAASPHFALLVQAETSVDNGQGQEILAALERAYATYTGWGFPPPLTNDACPKIGVWVVRPCAPCETPTADVCAPSAAVGRCPCGDESMACIILPWKTGDTVTSMRKQSLYHETFHVFQNQHKNWDVLAGAPADVKNAAGELSWVLESSAVWAEMRVHEQTEPAAVSRALDCKGEPESRGSLCQSLSFECPEQGLVASTRPNVTIPSTDTTGACPPSGRGAVACTNKQRGTYSAPAYQRWPWFRFLDERIGTSTILELFRRFGAGATSYKQSVPVAILEDMNAAIRATSPGMDLKQALSEYALWTANVDLLTSAPVAQYKNAKVYPGFSPNDYDTGNTRPYATAFLPYEELRRKDKRYGVPFMATQNYFVTGEAAAQAPIELPPASSARIVLHLAGRTEGSVVGDVDLVVRQTTSLPDDDYELQVLALARDGSGNYQYLGPATPLGPSASGCGSMRYKLPGSGADAIQLVAINRSDREVLGFDVAFSNYSNCVSACQAMYEPVALPCTPAVVGTYCDQKCTSTCTTQSAFQALCKDLRVGPITCRCTSPSTPDAGGGTCPDPDRNLDPTVSDAIFDPPTRTQAPSRNAKVRVTMTAVGASDPDGKIVRYSWSIFDPATMTALHVLDGASVSVELLPGQYEIHLSVFDNCHQPSKDATKEVPCPIDGDRNGCATLFTGWVLEQPF